MLLARNLLIGAVIVIAGYATVNLMRDESPAGRPSAAATPAPSTSAQPSSTNQNANSGGGGGQGSQAATVSSEQAEGNTGEAGENKPAEPEREQQQTSQRRGMFGGVLARQAATSVEVTWVEPSNQTAVIQLFGLIEAQQTVTVTATSAADVVAISAKEGDLVSAGSSLVTLASANTAEQLQQRQAALLEIDATIRNQQRKHESDLAALEIQRELLRIAKNSVDRFTSLSNQQLTSSDSYETALQGYQNQLLSVQSRELSIAQHDDTMQQLQAQRTQLQSQIRQAQQLVDDLRVLAPFDGRLAKVSVKQGQQVTNGAELVEIYNADSLALSVRVPLRYRLDQLDISALSATDSLGNDWQVTAIRPINEAGAQRLTLSPANSADIAALPGTHVSLSLSYPVSDTSAVTVPTTALYDQQRVYIFDSGAIKAVDVEVLGKADGGFVVRADSFVEPMPVITTRIKNPVSGMAVSISSAENRRAQSQSEGAGT